MMILLSRETQAVSFKEKLKKSSRPHPLLLLTCPSASLRLPLGAEPRKRTSAVHPYQAGLSGRLAGGAIAVRCALRPVIGQASPFSIFAASLPPARMRRQQASLPALCKAEVLTVDLEVQAVSTVSLSHLTLGTCASSGFLGV